MLVDPGAIADRFADLPTERTGRVIGVAPASAPRATATAVHARTPRVGG